MSELVRLYRASAHHLPMIETGAVQMICTSPPYMGLRKYDGEQDIEWPEVTYSPMAGLEPITVAGCDPECEHEWEVTSSRAKTGGTASAKVQIKDKDNFQIVPPIESGTCQKCGGWRGPLGNEPTIEAYIAHLILCAREWRRVLRDDGVCFVNLGDSYANNPSTTTIPRAEQGNGSGVFRIPAEVQNQARRQSPNRLTDIGLPKKNRLMIPARFALAMQADGWILRDEWVWHKPNPMPESVTDRATKAHEMIYVFSKRERYFWDADAVREPHKEVSLKRIEYGLKHKHPEGIGVGIPPVDTERMGERFCNPNGRNMRSVLTVATQPYAAAHFAVWPAALVEPMIKAGTSERGCCPTCGKCWRRVVEREPGFKAKRQYEQGLNGRRTGAATDSDYRGIGITRSQTVGWEPGCDCPAHEPVPCVVMDPFSGSGTTGRVALQLGRRYVGVDLSEEYLSELTPERLAVTVGMPL